MTASRLAALLRETPTDRPSVRKQHIVAAATALLDAATAERRELTAEETSVHNDAMTALERLNTEIRDGDRRPFGPTLFGSENAPNSGDLAGVLTREQRVSDIVAARLPEEQRGLSFGKYLRGIGTGNWRGAEREQRAAMQAGSDTAGGYLSPDGFGAMLIDLVRAQAVVQRLGARTTVMESGTMAWPKVTGDAGSSWHGELVNETATAMTFGLVNMPAYTLMSLARCSVELLEDVKPEALEQVVSQAMAQKLALALDLSCLTGNGAGQLQGVSTWPGITTDNFTTVTPDELSEMVSTLTAANFKANGICLGPTIDGRLARYKDGQGRYIDGDSLPSNLRGLPRVVSTQLPSTHLIVGDWSRMLIGYRTQLRFEVSREAVVDSVSSFSSLAVGFRAYLRVGMLLTHPDGFVVNTSITA